jgi:hypothetical protein
MSASAAIRVEEMHVDAPEQRILTVEFRSRDGRSWSAVGGGRTIAAAVHYARRSCPGGMIWDAVSWEDLYGE